MSALDFAAGIYFEKASPISGPFDISRYRMIEEPLLSLDNILTKQTVVYKASSTLGTIFLQIATAYRIAKKMGDMMNVAQTDDDAKKWSKTRGKPFLLRIKEIDRLVAADKNAITNELWQFIHKFLIVTGPGINSQNSDQVRFLHTDESHLQKAYLPGTLAALIKRMGGRWDSHGLHVTTAADEGVEIDLMYEEGTQKEWHQRCPKCNTLFWMLWEQDAKEFYSQRVFHWKEKQSLQATIESIEAECPHCGKFFKDESKTRALLNTVGGYVPMNTEAAITKESFRWSVFAASWISWGTILAEWLAALSSARLGDLKKHEDFRKKRECQSYKPEIPDLGEIVEGRDYKTGEIWGVKEEICRVLSFDVQDSPLHFWGQVDDFSRPGESRRVMYKKLETWAQLREYQLYYNVESKHVAIDAGHRRDEVFKACALWKWLAMFSRDEDSFDHYITVIKGQKKECIPKPYSQTSMQDSLTGKRKQKIERVRKGIPPGFCLSILWSKPQIASILFHLKSGSQARYYGIAQDIINEYIDQLHSYVPIIEKNKRTGAKKLIWKNIKPDNDHSFSTSSMNIITAMRNGYFPMDFSEDLTPQGAAEEEAEEAETSVIIT